MIFPARLCHGWERALSQVRCWLHSRVVQFFCTRPLVAFVGIMLMLQARSTSAARLTEMPDWTANSLVTLGYAAGVIAAWVLLRPDPSVRFRQWMGWVLVTYWVARGAGSASYAASTSSSFIEWTERSTGLWGWSIVAVLGAAMIAAPNPHHLWRDPEEEDGGVQAPKDQ